MGTRKNGRARRRHACLPRARPFSLSPTTSKHRLALHDATTGLPAKWRLSNDCRNFIPLTFTTQIWVMLLIGWSKFLSYTTNQKHYPDLGSDASSVWNFCKRYSDVIWRENQWWPLEMSAVSQTISTHFTRISFPLVEIWRTYCLNCLWGRRFAFLPQLSVSFNVKDDGRASVPRMVSSVARQNTPICRLDLDNLDEIWGLRTV